MKAGRLLALAVFTVFVAFCSCEIGLLPNYYSYTWASGLSSPRHMCTFSNGDVLVVQSGSIALLTDRGNTGTSTNKTIIASAAGLRSNMECHDGYIYANNVTHILRWAYTQGSTSFINKVEVVLANLPTPGHSNHPITFDPDGRIYVSIGSNENLDPTDYRAHIVRSEEPIDTLILPLNYPADVQIYAHGTRNEAGLRFNRLGELWGVENGMDNLNRTDLGPNLVTNNPGEELNLFPDYLGLGDIPIGKFYGYPYCFSEYMINSSASQGRGAQWFVPGYSYSDAWCKNTTNVQPPVFLMPAHNAPLDINYYEARNPAIQGTWPDFDAMYIALHGSWNRQPPSGYRVLKLILDPQTRKVISSQPFFYYKNNTFPELETNSNWYRPTAVSFGTCGGEDCLLIASDTTGDITAVKYRAPASSSGSTSASPSLSGSRSRAASPTPAAASSSPSASVARSSGSSASASGTAGVPVGVSESASSSMSPVMMGGSSDSDSFVNPTTSAGMRMSSWYLW